MYRKKTGAGPFATWVQPSLPQVFPNNIAVRPFPPQDLGVPQLLNSWEGQKTPPRGPAFSARREGSCGLPQLGSKAGTRVRKCSEGPGGELQILVGSWVCGKGGHPQSCFFPMPPCPLTRVRVTPDRDSPHPQGTALLLRDSELGGCRSKRTAPGGPASSLPGDKEPQNPDKTKFLKLKKKKRKKEKACRLPLPGSGLGWAGVVWGQGLSEASGSLSLS